jgi:hypothetical protein
MSSEFGETGGSRTPFRPVRIGEHAGGGDCTCLCERLGDAGDETSFEAFDLEPDSVAPDVRIETYGFCILEVSGTKSSSEESTASSS